MSSQLRDNDMVTTNLQENRSFFNKIRHIREIVNKLISLPKNLPAPDHIGDVVKIPLRAEWYDSIFTNYEEMDKSTTLITKFLCSLIPPETKLLYPRIYFGVKEIDIDNKYDLHSRTCAFGSSILEGVEFTVAYSPVAVII